VKIICCLHRFHAGSHALGELAYRFFIGLHRKDLFDHLSGFVKGHEASQVRQMFLLSGSETPWQ
jgi:hypothetical protein